VNDTLIATSMLGSATSTRTSRTPIISIGTEVR
jgi:hypothetical protein